MDLFDSRKKSHKGVLMQVNFEKSYDHVEWDFMDYMLGRLGYDLKWRLDLGLFFIFLVPSVS